MKHCMIEQCSLLTASVLSSFNRLIIIIAAFLLPINGILVTIGLSILADTAMGIWKAKKLKESVTSRKLSQIISKMFLYEATVILFFCIDSFLLNEIVKSFFTVPFLLTKIVAMTLVSIEVFSIDENWKAVKGKGIFDAFKSLVKRAKEIKDDTEKLK